MLSTKVQIFQECKLLKQDLKESQIEQSLLQQWYSQTAEL